jgi:hypothetical protein
MAAWSMARMSDFNDPQGLPDDPMDQRVRALLELRDELRALNARLEYVALMLRVSRAGMADPRLGRDLH